MSAQEKARILAMVAYSQLPRQRALAQLGLARSTYYRWLKRKSEGRLEDRRDGSRPPWSRLKPEEEEKVLVQARASPELSPGSLP